MGAGDAGDAEPAPRDLGPQGRARDYLEGVRAWLKTSPVTCMREDYNLYVKTTNPKRIAAGEMPLVKAGAIDNGLGHRWEEVIAIAEGRADLEQHALRRAQEDIVAGGELGLTGARAVTLMLGWSVQTVAHRRMRGEAPQPVARIGSYHSWFFGDIETFDAGRPWPRREQFVWQDRVMDSNALPEHLGRRQDSIWRSVSSRPCTLPPPAGTASGNHYWLRRDVLKWNQPKPVGARKPRSR